jgi:tetratricopeptide (TPR) repeat protein
MRSVIGLPAILATVFAFSGSARAALDSAKDQPYRVHVVLLVGEHRALTPLFRDQLTQTLHDRLRLRLGALAEVHVAHTHPLARAIQSRGLEAVDQWEETSDRQTHFITLDWNQGRYELQHRAYHGWTASADPTVQRQTISDRLQVGEAAARLIEQHFAPGGTVTRADKEIEVTLRAGILDENSGNRSGNGLTQWIKPGSVLAVSRVVKDGDRERATPMPWTLLEVLRGPEAGKVHCRLWRRYEQDDLREQPGVLGYRCQLVPTGRQPVRLRLLDEDSGAPLDGLQVYVSQPGTKKKVELSTDRNGLAVTPEPFSGFALVQVVAGNKVRAQFPVALVDDRAVVCRLKVQPESETLAGLELRRDQWVRRVYEHLRVATERVPELNLLLSKSLEAADAHARRGIEHLDDALDQLGQERDQLAKQAGKHKQVKIDLSEGEQRLAELKTRREELQQFIARVEQVMQDAKSEKTQALAKLLEQARLYEQDAEFDQAIALYEKVLEARPDQDNIKAQLQKLRAAWTPKNERHAKARAFLVQTWPRLDVGSLAEQLKQAEEALTVCREAGDRLTPLRLIHTTPVHVAKLKERLETLRRQNTEDSRNQLKAIANVAEGLRRLHAEALKLAGKDA